MIGMVKPRFRLIKEKIRIKKLSKLRVYILTAMILHNFWLQTSDGVFEVPAGEAVALRPGLNTEEDDDMEEDCSVRETLMHMVAAEPRLLSIAYRN